MLVKLAGCGLQGCKPQAKYRNQTKYITYSATEHMEQKFCVQLSHTLVQSWHSKWLHLEHGPLKLDGFRQMKQFVTAGLIDAMQTKISILG